MPQQPSGVEQLELTASVQLYDASLSSKNSLAKIVLTHFWLPNHPLGTKNTRNKHQDFRKPLPAQTQAHTLLVFVCDVSYS